MSIFDFKYPRTDFHELNLDWIVDHFKEFIDAIADLNDWRTEHEAEYQQLKALYDNLMVGNFPDSFKTALHNWVVANTASIIGAVIKMIFFEITSDGHLLVIIPDNWDDIIFGVTGYDTFPAGYSFGHLTITY